MSAAACSPFVAEVEVRSRDASGAVTTMEVDPREPVLEGHYPTFPIFPGVCLVEFANRSARSAPPDGAGELELAAVDSARFLSPVYPGDRLEAELEWARKDGDWRCSATLATERGGKAAQVRLRFRGRGG